MSGAFRCDGCGEFYNAREQLLDLDLNTDAVVGRDLTLDDIEDAYDIVWDGAQGDLCVECGRDALGALVELFGDGESGADGPAEESEPAATADTTDAATDAEVEAAVDDGDKLPEFEEALADADADDDDQDDGDDESLPPTAEEVVTALEEHGELPSAELKHITERSLQAISSNLSDLKDMGRVESRPDPDDGRRQLYSLVDDGQDDEHRVGDPIDEDSAAEQPTEADGGATTGSGSDLPVGVTEQDVRDAVDAAAGRQREGHAYLDDVADELNVRRTRARRFAHAVGVYGRVTDASGHKGGDA